MPAKGVASRRITDEQIAVFHKMREKGATYKEIGERCGYGMTTVRLALKRFLAKKVK
jgi:transposase